MVCAIAAFEQRYWLVAEVDPMIAPERRLSWYFGDQSSLDDETPFSAARETAEANDPFDDFEDDDFDDEFDDDFEEDWEDDLTEDDEFPDTFGGADEPDEAEPAEQESPFADDPDFDEA